MNITNFKEKVLTLDLKPIEVKRIKNLSGSHYRFMTKSICSYKFIGDHNFEEVWSLLSPKLEKEEIFNKNIRVMMDNSKHSFIDYSHLSYNGVTDDF